MEPRRMLKSLLMVIGVVLAPPSYAQDNKDADVLFTSVARIQIEIPAEGMKILREYNQEWRKPRPERIDVRVTIREGGKVYTNVAIHLKGSFSFQPIDEKPSLTLNFDKFAPGQRFHGLTKIHLNNSVQDPSYLCEMLARELFDAVDVPSPRAGLALAKLNGRDLGLFVLVEGANKQFVKRNFASTKGNLYDGASGGDVTKALKVDSGDNREDRSDLTNLVKAAREPDLAKRLARLEQLLDVERFISFAATEAFIVHWDGYAIGGNNYRLFHDVSRDKMVFIPSGMDQLFGVSRPLTLSITPPFKGMIAKALFAIPEARARYLARIAELSTNEFRVEALHARVDRLAARVRPALASNRQSLSQFEQSLRNLKSRIALRSQSVAQQLRERKRPVQFTQDDPLRLVGWSFKPGLTQPATSSRSLVDNREILHVIGRASNSSGAWRKTVLLEQGRYEFSGLARTDGLKAADGTSTNGVILRVSGERSTKGISTATEWTTLSYEFDIRGIEDVELVCEFRGGQPGSGFFDGSSLRLIRKGSALRGTDPASE